MLHCGQHRVNAIAVRGSCIVERLTFNFLCWHVPHGRLLSDCFFVPVCGAVLLWPASISLEALDDDSAAGDCKA